MLELIELIWYSPSIWVITFLDHIKVMICPSSKLLTTIKRRQFPSKRLQTSLLVLTKIALVLKGRMLWNRKTACFLNQQQDGLSLTLRQGKVCLTEAELEKIRNANERRPILSIVRSWTQNHYILMLELCSWKDWLVPSCPLEITIFPTGSKLRAVCRKWDGRLPSGRHHWCVTRWKSAHCSKVRNVNELDAESNIEPYHDGSVWRHAGT